MRPGLFTLALALTTSPVAAMADEPASGPPAPAPTSPPSPGARWYGAPIVYSDIASAALWGLAVGADAPRGESIVVPVAVLASLAYLVPSPLVHALHGHGWRAFWSVVLRGALPAAGLFVGGFVGAVTCTPPPWDGSSIQERGCGIDAFITGAIVGAAIAGLGAMVIDDAVLPWEPDEPAPAKASLRPPSLQWLPTLGVAHDSGNNTVPTLGIAGAF